MRLAAITSCVFFLGLACQTNPATSAQAQAANAMASKAPWAIAIHGGAGTMRKDAPAERLNAYRKAMRGALEHGRTMLQNGDTALDVCESVVRMLEDNELFNAGKGAVFNDQEEHELDASIMDGSTMQCGAVAGVRTIRHPITLARRVMTETRHVLLAGDGAEKFADLAGVERVENSWFDTDSRRRSLQRMQQQQRGKSALAAPRDRRFDYGTVGCVVLDQQGKLAAATSTGGMTGKKWGRVGDTPILGAGNYADGTAAVSCTGTGEEFIRHGVARSVSARMQYGGQTLSEAANAVIHDVLRPDDGGLIAVDKDGKIATPFNSSGMYRGMASSTGLFSVMIFEDQ